MSLPGKIGEYAVLSGLPAEDGWETHPSLLHRQCGSPALTHRLFTGHLGCGVCREVTDDRRLFGHLRYDWECEDCGAQGKACGPRFIQSALGL